MYNPTLISDTTEDGIRKVSFETSPAVCSERIDIETKDGIVLDVRYTGGCHGNTQGIGVLCRGMRVSDVIARLRGIDCHGRGTSCPDQLARALESLV